MPLPIDLILLHPDPAMADAFRSRFAELSRVRVLTGRFEELEPVDCFVTAGNAYGIMTAGIDAAVIGVHGESLMHRVQERVRNEYLGEQPVGASFVIGTGNELRPYIAHAPTMRTPGSIVGTDHVYAAAFAALTSIYRFNVAHDDAITSVAMPAMGTGFGGVSFDECARQMAVAYRHYLSPPYRFDWDEVIRRERAITYDGDRRVVTR